MADEQMKDNNQEESENRTTELMGIDSKIMKVKSYDWGGGQWNGKKILISSLTSSYSI